MLCRAILVALVTVTMIGDGQTSWNSSDFFGSLQLPLTVVNILPSTHCSQTPPLPPLTWDHTHAHTHTHTHKTCTIIIFIYCNHRKVGSSVSIVSDCHISYWRKFVYRSCIAVHSGQFDVTQWAMKLNNNVRSIKTALDWKPPERLKRGRPGRRWTQGTEEAMMGRNLYKKANGRIEKPGNWERRNGDSRTTTSLFIYL
jgi:hypothetical protein